MANLVGKNILVVGASGAFGQEFCIQLSKSEALVSGTSSSAESSVRLPAFLENRLLLDLNSDASVELLANYLLSNDFSVDGIILAAGLVGFSSIQETTPEAFAKLMQVNALGQINLVTRLLPLLAKSASENREPFVLSISGVISESPMPGLSAYSASKTALNGFAKSASKELRKQGIRWVDARPGHTDSGLASRALFGTAPNFGQGHTVTSVVSRILQGISEDVNDLPSDFFE